MGASWLMADPPGAYLDESAHYVKALGVAGGDLDGRRAVDPTKGAAGN